MPPKGINTHSIPSQPPQTPPWEQTISFKFALAVAAAQKRAFDEELRGRKEKTLALEQQNRELQAQVDSIHHSHTRESVLNSIFASNQTEDSLEGGDEDSLSSRLSQLSLSAHFWTTCASDLFGTSIHTQQFLNKVFKYVCLCDGDDNDGDHCHHHLLAPLTTPVQALLQTIDDIIRVNHDTSNISIDTRGILRDCIGYIAAIVTVGISGAAAVPPQLNHPSECMGPDDYNAIHQFIKDVMLHPCPKPLLQRQQQPSNDGDGNTDNKEKESALLTQCALDGFIQASSSTGCIVLGCAVQNQYDLLLSLKSIVTQEINNKEQEEDEEEAIIDRCIIQHALIVQQCLRLLPAWCNPSPAFSSLSPPSHPPTPSEEFLQQISRTIWESTEVCAVVAPAHPDVAKQGQRCAALLVDALQHISKS